MIFDKVNIEALIQHNKTTTVTITQVFRNNHEQPIKLVYKSVDFKHENIVSWIISIDDESIYSTDTFNENNLGNLNPSQTCRISSIYELKLNFIEQSNAQLNIPQNIIFSTKLFNEELQLTPNLIEINYTTDGITKLKQERQNPRKEDILIRIGNYHQNDESFILTTNTVGQPFDYYCVLDFEAVCHQINPKLNRIMPDDIWEIIEFPICLLESQTNRIVDIYHSYVRPTIRSQLNEKCIQITGITQQLVDQSPTFDFVWNQVQQFLVQHSLISLETKSILFSFTWITCGNWDLKTMLPLQLKQSGFNQPDFIRNFINLKDLYNEYYPSSHVRGMKDMLRISNLKLDGKHHSGIDDTKNITKIAQLFIRNYHVLKLTYKNST